MANALLLLVILFTAASSSPNGTNHRSDIEGARGIQSQNLRGGCRDINGQIKGDLTVWQREPCVRCVCRRGQIGCLTIKCSPNQKCRDGERIERLPSQCCFKCVREEGSCKEGNKLYANGTQWNSTNSEDSCKCENGTVQCTPQMQEDAKTEIDPNDVLADEPQDSSLTSEAGYLMTVFAGQPDTISSHHLWFNTTTADNQQIVFIITRKLRAPEEGRLILTGLHQAEVTSFTQKDLADMRLVYVPPHPDDITSEDVFCFPFVVWKYPERNKLTKEHSFCIKVIPKSEGEHMVFKVKNPEFTITKGGSIRVTKQELDIDKAGRHLRYIIVEAPIHGTLRFQSNNSSSTDITRGFEFKYSELEENSILYEHHGEDGERDYFEVIATDGWTEAGNQYLVNVLPDAQHMNHFSTQSPSLVILEGEQVLIKRSFLVPQSTAGMKKKEGYYTLHKLPKYGKMIMVDEEEGEFPLGIHFAFSITDVEDGKLIYRAANEIGSESRTERLIFNFDSGGSDKETQIDLEVSILPVDNQAPTVAVNGVIVVAEGSTETLPPSLLTIRDVDTPIHSLNVEIIKQPYFGHIKASRGGLDPQPVDNFSMEEFLQGKISYQQSYSRKVEPIEDALLFRVTDGTQASHLTRLNISIDLKNDESPEIFTNVLHVESGKTKVIDKDTFHVEDVDTEPGSILITITQPPTQGVLRKRLFQWRPIGSGQSMSANDTLVYMDVLQGLLTYSAIGGGKATDDFFTFQITDGKFNDRGKLVISIAHPDGDINARIPDVQLGTSTTTTPISIITKAELPPGNILESRSKEVSIEIPQGNDAPTKILPTRPVVVTTAGPWSTFAGDTNRGGPGPGPGRPLLCIPSCHPHHPLTRSSSHVCNSVKLNDVHYSWEVSVPIDSQNDRYLPFEPLEESTVFADVKGNTLDPLYFSRRFRVRCTAKLPAGLPVKSEYVSIEGSTACDSVRTENWRGSVRTFSAKLSYVNSSSQDHANTLKVNLSIPHFDGMVPLVSTYPLSDPNLLLTDSMYRAHHVCSNLIPGKGFLANRGTQSGRWRMYEGKSVTTVEGVIPIYEYLDYDGCEWHFEAWFTVGTLVEECGGKVISDVQGKKEGQRYLKVKVPLYISHVVASSPSMWTATEYKTELEFSMQYSSFLWNKGFQTQPAPSARLQANRIAVDDAGRLIVDFTTYALFRGRFVSRNYAGRTLEMSEVRPPLHLRQTINLTLELLDVGERENEQSWRMTSNVAIEDYTGEYSARLLPCVPVLPEVHHRGDGGGRGLPCTVGPHIEIPIQINFRQIGRPEPITYSLETEFYLAKKPPSLSYHDDDLMKDMQNTEPENEMYSPGDEVYGLVMWHPSQDLSRAYRLSIQRLYLCSGTEDHVPVYDPTGEIYGKGPQYGCIQPSKNLKHRLLLLDKIGNQNINREYKGIPFEVHSASEMAEFKGVLNYSGVDGFSMKVDPLYRINAGSHWYLQVLYSISPSRSRSKREIPLNTDERREKAIKKQQMTNMRVINLDEIHSESNVSDIPWYFAGFLVFPILLGCVCLKFCSKRKSGMVDWLRQRNVTCKRNFQDSDRSDQCEPLNNEVVCEARANNVNKLFQPIAVGSVQISESAPMHKNWK